MPSLWITGPNGSLVPLQTGGYANEKDFQKLLADNPAVLAGALAEGDDESWLLIAQELAIKANEPDTGTWKLDHLFVASDATPVLVEVKRSSDPRARREVVAQMLDYAASFDTDWSAVRLRGRREQRFIGSQTGARLAEMEEFLAVAGFDDENQLWAAVQTKIDAGQLRLLFVADQLSPTLVRIIEYLNGQLRNAEVLGVEVLRHAGTDTTAVAYQPVVRGRSSVEARRKAPPQRCSREEFDAVTLTRYAPPLLSAINDLVARSEEIGAFVSLGTSAQDPALYINFYTNGGAPVYWPLLLRPRPGKLIVRTQKLRTHPALKDESVRDELLARVAGATGTEIRGNVDGAPWVPLTCLNQPTVIEHLADVLKWIKEAADSGHQGGAEAT